MHIAKRAFFAIGFVFALASFSALSRAGDKDVSIKAMDTMKYDILAVEAEPGQTLNITLTNAGKMPKIAMAHNLVILKPGTDVNAFAAAASRQAADSYLPVAEADSILAATKLLGPGESDTIHFTPTESGTYDFICTFPAHAMAGMHGTITVK